MAGPALGGLDVFILPLLFPGSFFFEHLGGGNGSSQLPGVVGKGFMAVAVCAQPWLGLVQLGAKILAGQIGTQRKFLLRFTLRFCFGTSWLWNSPYI